jgi:UDP-GlcNAc:undecaprenyl-phosphate GlcNAc-1-phosphate transferase
MFWLLGAMNAINLLDGIDGLATLLGIILSATIAALAALRGNYGVAVTALVLTGALTGYLRYNLPPARMYLGDAGSMLIGLMVGAMAIRAMLKGPGAVLLAAPVAMWAIPILDSGAAILRRRLTGRSVFVTDRGHLHHRLLEALGSNTKVLMVVGVCCVVTSAGAMASVWMKSDAIALIVCLGVVAMLAATGVFGRVELRLLLSRLRSVGASLGHPTYVGGVARESQVRLQGTQKWEVLWETLTESAEKLRLSRVHLDVNAPALHESYVATWTHAGARDLERCWRLELPLSVGDLQVGHLDIRGRRNGGSGLEEIAQLLDLLEPFAARLATFTKGDDVQEPALTK